MPVPILMSVRARIQTLRLRGVLLVEYAKRWVTLRFYAQSKEWVVSDETGKELKRHTSKEITAEKVMALQVINRKKKKQGQGA
jgi:hypothetical protein